MVSKESRQKSREKKHLRIRNRFSGTAERPRLAVFRSNNHIYAQILDESGAKTVVHVSTLSKEVRDAVKTGGNKEAALYVGKVIAEKAKAKNISSVVFDRSGFLYHGRVKVLADSARENGLKF